MHIKGFFIIVLSIMIALMLSFIPLPEWVQWFRPEWVLLVFIYWVLALPRRMNIGTGWCLGILMDVVNGTVLGEHAIAMALIGYIVAKEHRQLRMMPILQQMLMILLLLLLYQLVIFTLQSVLSVRPTTMMYWLPSLTSFLFWPWLYLLLRNCRRHAKLHG